MSNPFKLTKMQQNEKAALAIRLNEAASTFEDARLEYNDVLGLVRDFMTEVHDVAEEAYEEKSERWKEGDRGAATQAWIETWNTDDLEDIEETNFEISSFEELPDQPE